MKLLATIAAALGLLGVVLGAFGAHGLENSVTPARLAVWKTAVSYQMYHAPVLLLIAWFGTRIPGGWLTAAAICLLGGVAIFSGTLYLLVWFDLPVLGMITPIGGTLLIAGWLLLAVAIVRDWPASAGEK